MSLETTRTFSPCRGLNSALIAPSAMNSCDERPLISAAKPSTPRIRFDPRNAVPHPAFGSVGHDLPVDQPDALGRDSVFLGLGENDDVEFYDAAHLGGLIGLSLRTRMAVSSAIMV